jgi:hypothetical protein
MATSPDSAAWSLEQVSLKVTGRLLRPLDEYHPRVLDAILNHLPGQLQQEAARRMMAADDEDDEDFLLDDEEGETGDPEWDEMNRALRAGIDPTTLPSWDGDDNGG